MKFQTILPEQLVMPDQTARLEQLRRFQLSAEVYRRLARVAQECGVMFMSTPFALEAVDLLDPLVPAFKIASGDNNYTALLEKVAKTGKPVVLSTGMTTLDETKAAIATFEAGHGGPAMPIRVGRAALRLGLSDAGGAGQFARLDHACHAGPPGGFFGSYARSQCRGRGRGAWRARDREALHRVEDQVGVSRSCAVGRAGGIARVGRADPRRQSRCLATASSA